eukprot:g27985.t1
MNVDRSALGVELVRVHPGAAGLGRLVPGAGTGCSSGIRRGQQRAGSSDRKLRGLSWLPVYAGRAEEDRTGPRWSGAEEPRGREEEGEWGEPAALGRQEVEAIVLGLAETALPGPAAGLTRL